MHNDHYIDPPFNPTHRGTGERERELELAVSASVPMRIG